MLKHLHAIGNGKHFHDESVLHTVAGVLAGFAATAPMTAAMELLFRRLPRHEQYPLPPREITEELTERTDIGDDLPEPHHQALTMAAHFGYGSSMGALYGLIFPRETKAPMLQGTAFGLGVWAASYLGLLPALGILKPATHHPPRRTLLMIAAHIVWGSTLGVLTNTARRALGGENRATSRARESANAAARTQEQLGHERLQPKGA